MQCDRAKGNPGAAVPLCRAAFGANKFKAIPPKSFFRLWFGNLKDPTLIMLMIAALVGNQSCRRLDLSVLLPSTCTACAFCLPLAAARQPRVAQHADAALDTSTPCSKLLMPCPPCRSPQCWALLYLRSGSTARGLRVWPFGLPSLWCPSWVSPYCFGSLVPL